ncbi:MAG: hypothetical protein NC390_05475 [Fusobacterium sp.]|nr:hypothetical protein [Fusobacterium sp.]
MGSGTTISAVKPAATTRVAERTQQKTLETIHSNFKVTPEYVMTLKKLNAVDSQIEALKGQLKSVVLSDNERSKIQQQLEDLEAVAKLRAEMADYAVSKDGKTVTFTLNSYYPVEMFKDTFDLKDGAFRDAVGREALQEAGAEGESGAFKSFEDAKRAGVTRFANGVYIDRNWFGIDKVDYSKAILKSGRQYSVDASYLK